MAFNGYLLKVSGDEFPLTYVKENSYRIFPNRRLDLDTQRMATGKLDRTVLDHRPSTIELSIRPLNNTELEGLMSFLRERYINEAERKLILNYYCPDINDYKDGEFYVPDTEYPIDKINYEHKVITYKEFTLEFIGY